MTEVSGVDPRPYFVSGVMGFALMRFLGDAVNLLDYIRELITKNKVHKSTNRVG